MQGFDTVNPETMEPEVDVDEMGLLDIEWLDEMIGAMDGVHRGASLLLAGRMVIWHNGEAYPLVICNHDLRIEIELVCAKGCGAVEKALLGPGLHRNAWCYVYDAEGRYVANLRDQQFVCDRCSSGGKL